jgi:hypothetical protein
VPTVATGIDDKDQCAGAESLGTMRMPALSRTGNVVDGVSLP